MTAERISEEELQKTIKIDCGIRNVATSIGALSAATVCLNPFVLIPAAGISGIVFLISEHQIKENKKRLNSLSSTIR